MKSKRGEARVRCDPVEEVHAGLHAVRVRVHRANRVAASARYGRCNHLCPPMTRMTMRSITTRVHSKPFGLHVALKEARVCARL